MGENFENVDPQGYAIFVLVQFLPNGEIKTRDYTFTYDECLTRKEIELQMRPGATLACVVQTEPPPPPVQRDDIGSGALLIIVATGVVVAVRRAIR